MLRETFARCWATSMGVWVCGPVHPQPSQLVRDLQDVYAREKWNTPWVYAYLEWCVALLKSDLHLCMFQGSARSRFWVLQSQFFFQHFLCMGVLSACMSVSHGCAASLEARRRSQPQDWLALGAGVVNVYELPCGCWALSQCPWPPSLLYSLLQQSFKLNFLWSLFPWTSLSPCLLWPVQKHLAHSPPSPQTPITSLKGSFWEPFHVGSDGHRNGCVLSRYLFLSQIKTTHLQIPNV